MSANNDTRTATQRIEDLEKVVTTLYQGLAESVNTLNRFVNLPGDVSLIKDALKLLNKKTEAIIQAATAETGITTDSVSALVTKMNVADLTAQVAQYVANGQLVATDTAADDSYLVCEESNTEGVVVNPRIQFRLDSVEETVRETLKGKKVGDLVSFGENKFNVKVLELYTLVTQKAADTTAQSAAPAADATPAEAAAAATDAALAAATPATEAPAADTTQALAPLPAEAPVAEFVPSDLSNAITANS